MHILIAPNAFKNSLSAIDAASAIRAGLLKSRLVCTTQLFPVGDGGDGTASLLVKNKNGSFQTAIAEDPLRRRINTTIGFIDDGHTAVIEMADISGLRLLGQHEKNPLLTSSFGTGELIRFALDKKAGKIILGIGGSATVDGGCGALQALGIRFLDDKNRQLTCLPRDLNKLAAIDSSFIDKRILKSQLILLCDVGNPLLGVTGAAAVFGPQKGAGRKEVIELESCLFQLRNVVLRETGKDMATLRGGGAAGGIAAGFHVFLNAQLVEGIEYFLDINGFDEALQHADLVITGEGSIDLQTLLGKAPFGVARRAGRKKIPVIGLAGQVDAGENNELNFYFNELRAINPDGENISTSMKRTAINLQDAAQKLGDQLSDKSFDPFV